MAGFDSDIGGPGISVAVLDKPTRPKFVVSAPVPPLPDLRATVHYPTEAEIRSGQTDEVTYQTLTALRLGLTPSREAALALVKREINGPEGRVLADKKRALHRFYAPFITGMHALSKAEFDEMRRRIIVDPNPPPPGFWEKTAEEALSRVTYELVSKMPDAVQLEAMQYFTRNLDKVDLYSEEEASNTEAVRALNDFLLTSPDRGQIIPNLMAYVQRNTDDYTYKVFESSYHEHTMVDFAVKAIGNVKECYPEVVRYLAGMEDDVQMIKMLGIFVDRSSFAEIINSVRKTIENGENVALRLKLERIGRLLLGFDPDDTSRNFHANLDEFYKACDLGKMEHLQEATEADIGIITAGITENHLENDLKLDLGCGQGRTTLEMIRRNPAMRGWIGVDIAPSSVEIANTEAKKLGIDGQVSFRVGDWKDVKEFIPDGSVGFVSIIGRNLHHEYDLAAVAREVKRVLKKGGRVRFDFADNNIGIYRKLRERLYHIYMRLGIPLDWLGNGEIEAGLKHLETTVDCPDPKNPAAANWTDRSVPHKETIVNTFKEVGLSCREIGRREIKGWDDPQYGSSLNVYYEAVNV